MEVEAEVGIGVGIGEGTEMRVIEVTRESERRNFLDRNSILLSLITSSNLSLSLSLSTAIVLEKWIAGLPTKTVVIIAVPVIVHATIMIMVVVWQEERVLTITRPRRV